MRTKGFGRAALGSAQGAPLKLLGAKFSLNEVARRIGCAASSVMRWRNAWRRTRRRFPSRLRFSPGRPRRLTRRQERQLVRILLQGAVANGYRTELWDDKASCGSDSKELPHAVPFSTPLANSCIRLGWTHQKPEGRALERNEKAIERWKRKDWPRVKKRHAAGRPPSLLRTKIGLLVGSPGG